MTASALALALLLRVQSAPTAPPAVEPAPQSAPAATPSKNALEAAMEKLPPFFWDPAAPLEARITRFSNFVMLGVGGLSLVVSLFFLALTGFIQRSPIPDTDPRERPRATLGIAAMVTTALLMLTGVVCVLGSLYALVAL